MIVVDTSNEIAGGGAVPHPCIGRARRLPVRDRADQPAILLEAVQNHTAQVRILLELCEPGSSNDRCALGIALHIAQMAPLRSRYLNACLCPQPLLRRRVGFPRSNCLQLI